MDMLKIIKNAVRYPFSSIKNILILGIIIFTGFSVVFTSLFSNGYFLRIIQASLDGESNPPKFENWSAMFLDGLKVYVVSVGYSLPLFLIFVILASIISFSNSFSHNSAAHIHQLSVAGFIAAIITILYVIIIIPIFLMALVRMVHNGALNAAFEFREILNKIGSLGWKNFIKWYIITIVPSVVLTIGALFLGSIISNIIHLQQLIFLIVFILAPIFMYISRSAALFYMSGNDGYLACEECGGYYELQDGESSEDYDQCRCGGKLEYSTLIPSSSESGDLSSDKSDIVKDNNKLSSFLNFKNKKFLVIFAILALTIISIPFLYSTNTQTPINYTLLGSYNASNLDYMGTSIIIPNGTNSIKIEYNLQAQGTQGADGLGVEAYNIVVSRGSTPNYNQRYIDAKGFNVVNGQNKTGTIIFNNPDIKSILLTANGMQGNIKIYTSH